MTKKNDFVHEIEHGSVLGRIWENEGTKGVWFSLSICRLYRLKDGNSGISRSNRLRDLTDVAKVVDDAYKWLDKANKRQGLRGVVNPPSPNGKVRHEDEGGAESGALFAQIQAQQAPVGKSTASQESTEVVVREGDMQGVAILCNTLQTSETDPGGLEPPTYGLEIHPKNRKNPMKIAVFSGNQPGIYRIRSFANYSSRKHRTARVFGRYRLRFRSKPGTYRLSRFWFFEANLRPMARTRFSDSFVSLQQLYRQPI